MSSFAATHTKNRDWNILDIVSPIHKDNLLKDLITYADNGKLYSTNKLDNWFSVGKYIAINVISLAYKIKNIEESIKVYYTKGKSTTEFIITSKEYQKTIFDSIVDLVIEYESVSQTTVEFYYISEDQLKHGIENAIEI